MIILSLVILFFVTKDYYSANLEKSANLQALNSQSDELKGKLDNLNSIKSAISSDPKMQKLLSQF